MPSSNPVTVASEVTPVWSIVDNGQTYFLSPADDISPSELYQIMAWKEWCSVNPHLQGKPERAAVKAKELGIIRHFASNGLLEKVGTNEKTREAV